MFEVVQCSKAEIDRIVLRQAASAKDSARASAEAACVFGAEASVFPQQLLYLFQSFVFLQKLRYKQKLQPKLRIWWFTMSESSASAEAGKSPLRYFSVVRCMV